MRSTRVPPQRFRARPRGGLRTRPAGRRPRADPAADAGGRTGRAPRLRLRRHRRGRARPLPRHGAHPPHRRRGDRAPAARRARHLGPAARPGGRPDRRRPRPAPAGLRLPDLPRARRRLVPRRRPAQPARPVPRRRPGRLGPQRQQLRALHDRHRRPDAARHRLRHGHAARRRRRHRRPRPRQRRDRPLRRRRLLAGRRQRGLHLRRVLQRPGRLLLPEQPVGHLRAHRAADPHPALPAGARLRLPGPARRRQRRARDARRHQGRAAAGPRRPGPDVRRGLHLPDGRAHHDRRPDPLPAQPTTSRSGSCATRSPASRSTSSATVSPTTSSSTTSRTRPTTSGRTCARAARRWPTRSRCRSSTTSTPR